MPARYQRKRAKGWRLPPNGRCVTRPGVFGNPFTVAGAREAGYQATDDRLAEWCVSLFRQWVTGRGDPLVTSHNPARRAKLLAALPTLRGKDLYCFCPEGRPCHADVLLDLANREEPAHAH